MRPSTSSCRSSPASPTSRISSGRARRAAARSAAARSAGVGRCASQTRACSGGSSRRAARGGGRAEATPDDAVEAAHEEVGEEVRAGLLGERLLTPGPARRHNRRPPARRRSPSSAPRVPQSLSHLPGAAAVDPQVDLGPHRAAQPDLVVARSRQPHAGLERPGCRRQEPVHQARHVPGVRVSGSLERNPVGRAPARRGQAAVWPGRARQAAHGGAPRHAAGIEALSQPEVADDGSLACPAAAARPRSTPPATSTGRARAGGSGPARSAAPASCRSSSREAGSSSVSADAPLGSVPPSTSATGRRRSSDAPSASPPRRKWRAP